MCLFNCIVCDIVAFVSRERIRAKAMDFLHKMEYNYTQAKFYILFPYYLKYNSYRSHDPLRISNEEMEKKINDHLQGLQNTKQKDMEKWIQNIHQCLENRVLLNKIFTLVEIGRQQKYQIPQCVRQQIQRSVKAGRQIRKFVQGNKLQIDSLTTKKEQIQQNKIITPEMVSFEDTVTRCSQWIKKQQTFENAHFNFINGVPHVKKNEDKIQFRAIQLLFNEYNSLPLLHPTFNATTLKLYNSTKQLLDKIPTFRPTAAKTRTAKENTVNKISYKLMKDSLNEIQNHPVFHEEFLNFEVTMRESMELLERISMYLEDSQSDKSVKVLNNYLKLINDVQIENKLEKRLQLRVEYYEIMERIKKELGNPGKVDSIKEALNKLKEKGFKEIQDSGYQEKIILYLGWYESQQKLKEEKTIPKNIDIIKKELEIKKKLVNVEQFKSQFSSAKFQLTIGEEALEENEERLRKYELLKAQVVEIINNEDPNLEEMLNVLRLCIYDGLNFPEFEQLYDQVVKYFLLLAKMQFLLKIKSENLTNMEEEFFFTDHECDEIISICITSADVKDLKTKEGASAIIEQVRDLPFPRYRIQWKRFQQFMEEGQKWCDETMLMIKQFKEKGGVSINTKQLEDSRYYLHSKTLKDEINRIDLILKWRDKISKKLEEEKEPIFDEDDQIFIQKLQKDLIALEKIQVNSQAMEGKVLEFSQENSEAINILLEKISNCRIENVCKLTEMNKFFREIVREVERYKFDDKVINEQKEKFREEINLSEDWKERYTVIKRFERKKIKKDDEHAKEDENREEENYGKEGLFMPQDHNDSLENNKKKYSIKNPQFSWYFKFYLVVLEFYKGYQLKFCLDELQRLKTTLTQIWRFIQHFNKLYEKEQCTDMEVYNLEGEGSKLAYFIREYWILKKHWNYIYSWKMMADSIIESVPIIGMQLKARKPQQLLKVLQTKKIETEEAQKATNEEKSAEIGVNKRQRKPNKLYNNEDITLLTEENAGPKIKKKRKGNNNDGEYRNTAVASQAKKNISNLEEIERTEALLKSEYAPNLICIQDPKEYCICRYGQPNENTTMLQCQEANCEEWFHIECIGIKKHQTKNDMSYVCVGCHSLRGEKSMGNFFWDSHSKVSEYAFEQIVKEGQNLGVQTQQMKKIKIIEEKMVEWKKNANELIEKVMVNDLLHKPIKLYERELYELYLHSLWLPTFHTEAETLKIMVQVCRQQS